MKRVNNPNWPLRYGAALKETVWSVNSSWTAVQQHQGYGSTSLGWTGPISSSWEMREQVGQEEQQQGTGTPWASAPNWTPSSAMSGAKVREYWLFEAWPGLIWCSHFSTAEVWTVTVKVAQPCPALRDPMDCAVYGILQARIPEWVALPFTRGSSQPRDQTQVSHIAGGFFTSWLMGTPEWVISINRRNPCKNQWYVEFCQRLSLHLLR